MHLLVKKRNFDIIKMHSTTIKTYVEFVHFTAAAEGAEVFVQDLLFMLKTFKISSITLWSNKQEDYFTIPFSWIIMLLNFVAR